MTYRLNTEKVRALLAKQNMTVNRLARAMDAEQATVHRALSGDTKDPGIDLIGRMAAVLGTSLDELCQAEGNNEKGAA